MNPAMRMGRLIAIHYIIYIYMPVAPETAKKAGSARVQGPPFRRAAIFAMAARKYARGRND